MATEQPFCRTRNTAMPLALVKRLTLALTLSLAAACGNSMRTDAGSIPVDAGIPCEIENLCTCQCGSESQPHIWVNDCATYDGTACKSLAVNVGGFGGSGGGAVGGNGTGGGATYQGCTLDHKVCMTTP